jgi:hypothetical protein
VIKAILSVSSIRYRHSQLTAVHGTDLADRSGNRMHISHPSADIRPSDNLNQTTMAIAHLMLCRTAGSSRNQMQILHAVMGRD